MRDKITVPNLITSLRILGTVCLMFFKPLTLWFFIVYTLAGLTDLLDGYIARKTHTVSDFGAKLDSIADLLYYALMLFKVLPILWSMLPRAIWYVVGAIVLSRICSYVFVAVRFHRFASPHTKLNKLSGAVMFAVPYMLVSPVAVYYCWGVCVVSALATAQDWVQNLSERNVKSKAEITAE